MKSRGPRTLCGAAWLFFAVALVGLALIEGVWAARDYYKVLGVDKQADDRTIKRAYRVRMALSKAGWERKCAD